MVSSFIFVILSETCFLFCLKQGREWIRAEECNPAGLFGAGMTGDKVWLFWFSNIDTCILCDVFFFYGALVINKIT